MLTAPLNTSDVTKEILLRQLILLSVNGHVYPVLDSSVLGNENGSNQDQKRLNFVKCLLSKDTETKRRQVISTEYMVWESTISKSLLGKVRVEVMKDVW